MIKSYNVNYNNPTSKSFEASLRAPAKAPHLLQQRWKQLVTTSQAEPPTSEQSNQIISILPNSPLKVVRNSVYLANQQQQQLETKNSIEQEESRPLHQSVEQRIRNSQYSNNALSALSKSNARILIPYLLGPSSRVPKQSQSLFQKSQLPPRPTTQMSIEEPDLVTMGDEARSSVPIAITAGPLDAQYATGNPGPTLLLICPPTMQPNQATGSSNVELLRTNSQKALSRNFEQVGGPAGSSGRRGTTQQNNRAEAQALDLRTKVDQSSLINIQGDYSMQVNLPIETHLARSGAVMAEHESRAGRTLHQSRQVHSSLNGGANSETLNRALQNQNKSLVQSFYKSNDSTGSREGAETYLRSSLLFERGKSSNFLYRRVNRTDSRTPRETYDDHSKSPSQYYPGKFKKEGIAAKTADFMRQKLVQEMAKRGAKHPSFYQTDPDADADSYMLGQTLQDRSKLSEKNQVQLKGQLKNDKSKSAHQAQRKNMNYLKNQQDNSRNSMKWTQQSNMGNDFLKLNSEVLIINDDPVETSQDSRTDKFRLSTNQSNPLDVPIRANQNIQSFSRFAKVNNYSSYAPAETMAVSTKVDSDGQVLSKKPKLSPLKTYSLNQHNLARKLQEKASPDAPYQNTRPVQGRSSTLQSKLEASPSARPPKKPIALQSKSIIELRSSLQNSRALQNFTKLPGVQTVKQADSLRGGRHQISIAKASGGSSNERAHERSPMQTDTRRHENRSKGAFGVNDYEEKYDLLQQQSGAVQLANQLTFHSSLGKYDVVQRNKSGGLHIVRKPSSKILPLTNSSIKEKKPYATNAGLRQNLLSKQGLIRKRIEEEAKQIKLGYSMQMGEATNVSESGGISGKFFLKKRSEPDSDEIHNLLCTTSRDGDKDAGNHQHGAGNHGHNHSPSKQHHHHHSKLKPQRQSKNMSTSPPGYPSEQEMLRQMLNQRFSPQKAISRAVLTTNKMSTVLKRGKAKRKKRDASWKKAEGESKTEQRQEVRRESALMSEGKVNAEAAAQGSQTEQNATGPEGQCKEQARNVFIDVEPPTASPDISEESFEGFDIQDQTMACASLMVTATTSRRRPTLGRILVSDRLHQFKIELQQQQKDPNIKGQHRMMVAWLAAPPLQGARVYDLFKATPGGMKKVTLDPWLGPKIFNKGVVQFEKGAQYVYFKFWCEDVLPAGEQEQDAQANEDDEILYSDSEEEDLFEYKVKVNINFGKKNYDEESLIKKGLLVAEQVVEDAKENAPNNATPRSNQASLVAQSRRRSLEKTVPASQVTHELEQLTSAAATDVQTTPKQKQTSPKPMRRDPSNATSNRPPNIAGRLEIESIFKQYSTTNPKQALVAILSNADDAAKITANLEYLKNACKGIKRDGTNFVNKNAQRAKDTEIKNIASINSELAKHNTQLRNSRITSQVKSKYYRTMQGDLAAQKKSQDPPMVNANSEASLVTVGDQKLAQSTIHKVTFQESTIKKSVIASSKAQKKDKLRRWEERVNEKVMVQIKNLHDKRDQTNQRAAQVAQKNEQLILENRQKKEFLLIRQAVLKKEREDNLIDLKNRIIRRCWRVHMCAEIILQKILMKVGRDAYNLLKLRQWKFKRALAVGLIIRGARRYLRRFGNAEKRLKKVYAKAKAPNLNEAMDTLKPVSSSRKPQRKRLQSDSKKSSRANVRQLGSGSKQQPAQQFIYERLLPQMSAMTKHKNIMAVRNKNKQQRKPSNELEDKAAAANPSQSGALIGMAEPAPLEVSLKQRETLRHCLTLVIFPKYAAYEIQDKAKKIFGLFMQDQAKSFQRVLVFRQFYCQVQKLNEIVRRVLRIHRVQNEVLYALFEKVKNRMTSEIMLANAKATSSSTKKDALYNDILERLQNMSPWTKLETLTHYMNHCRHYFDEEIERKRKLLREGINLQQSNIVFEGVFVPPAQRATPQVQRSSKPSSGMTSNRKVKDKDKEKKQQDASKDPQSFEDFLKVHSFDQIRRNDEEPEQDFLSNLHVNPKTWKKIHSFHDKMFPKHKSETKKHMAKLHAWLQDPVNQLIYRSHLKYVPTESNMAILILAAVLKDDLGNDMADFQINDCECAVTTQARIKRTQYR